MSIGKQLMIGPPTPMEHAQESIPIAVEKCGAKIDLAAASRRSANRFENLILREYSSGAPLASADTRTNVPTICVYTLLGPVSVSMVH